MAADNESEAIADVADLEAFNSLPAGQRHLTAKLKGVLAETACTGVIRYQWSLIRPLLVQLMETQLREYEAAEHVDVGPARPLLLGDDSVAALTERFTGMLAGFQGPPWTLQRLCELLLEPRKQYQRLHKLALALEKLLLVTGEAELTPAPGPAPRLIQLTRVNEAPANAATAAAAAGGGAVGQKRPRSEDADAGGLVAAALTVKQQPATASAAAQQQQQAAANQQGQPQQQQQEEQQQQQEQQHQRHTGAVAATTAAATPAAAAAEEEQEAAAAAPSAMDVDGAPSSSNGTAGETAAPVAEQPTVADAAAATAAVADSIGGQEAALAGNVGAAVLV